jgi:hypothetical protein
MQKISFPITSPYTNVRVSSTNSSAAVTVDDGSPPSVQGVSTVRPDVNISSLANRLSKAENFSAGANSNLSHDQLGEKVQKNIERINYPLTGQNKARMAKDVPEPSDASALASASAASDYVNNLSGPNPFAGLSREQLSMIANDESGTFTTNEKYAAYRQAYDEEQVWRSKAVAEAMEEYHGTGKLTDFFKSALEHFNELPSAEQSLYPKDYATDLQEKIDLDFNYFTNMPHGLPGKADISLANLNSKVADLIKLPDSFPGFPASK